MKRGILIGVICGILIIASIILAICKFVLFPSSLQESMELVSRPTGAQVWLDGREIGKTPITIRIDDAKEHALVVEIEKGYQMAEYKFDKSTMAKSLAVKLIPSWHAPNPYNWMNSDITADWKWHLQSEDTGWRLVNEEEPSRSIAIDCYPTVVSPNGKWIICYEGFLLINIENGKYNKVFQNIKLAYTGPYYLGFSPDTKWFFVTGFPTTIFSTEEPETVALSTDDLWIPGWSPDSQWLANSNSDYDIHIYHLVDGVWQTVPSKIKGLPIGWSSDNKILWVGYWDANKVVIPIRLFDVSKDRVISTLEEGRISWPVESPDGSMFAFTGGLDANFDENWHLTIVDRNGNKIYSYSDPNYDFKNVFYWLNEGKQIAVQAESRDDYFMMILNVPENK
jgi:hypothetical protein